MRRNKKFYQHKEMLRLRREENKYWNSWRKNRLKEPKTIRCGSGYRRSVSKTLCPSALYNDLKSLVNKLHRVCHEPSDWSIDYRNRSYNDEEYIFLRYTDPMLEELTQYGWEQLEPGEQVLMRPVEVWERQYSHEYKQWISVRTNHWQLDDKYRNYLFIEKVPQYRQSFWDYTREHYQYSEYCKLRNKIDGRNLRPKMFRAKSRPYKYRDECDIDLRHKEKQRAEKEMREEIADYLADKEE